MWLDLGARTMVLAAAAASLAVAGCNGGGGTGTGCYTPLVLSFDGGPVEYFVNTDSAYFELGQHDESVMTDWPTPKTPWLARDLDGDGKIGGGNELFGSETVLRDGRKAKDGFEALRELDSNGDGLVSPADKEWGSLLVWHDYNSDRRTDPGELRAARDLAILWVSLPASTSPTQGSPAGSSLPPDLQCEPGESCEGGRSRFGYSSFTSRQIGTVIDIHLQSWVPSSSDGESGFVGGSCN